MLYEVAFHTNVLNERTNESDGRFVHGIYTVTIACPIIFSSIPRRYLQREFCARSKRTRRDIAGSVFRQSRGTSSLKNHAGYAARRFVSVNNVARCRSVCEISGRQLISARKSRALPSVKTAIRDWLLSQIERGARDRE